MGRRRVSGQAVKARAPSAPGHSVKAQPGRLTCYVPGVKLCYLILVDSPEALKNLWRCLEFAREEVRRMSNGREMNVSAPKTGT